MHHDGEYIAIKKESTTSPFVVDSFLLCNRHEKTEKTAAPALTRAAVFYNFYFLSLSYTAQSSRKRTLPVSIS